MQVTTQRRHWENMENIGWVCDEFLSGPCPSLKFSSGSIPLFLNIWRIEKKRTSFHQQRLILFGTRTNSLLSDTGGITYLCASFSWLISYDKGMTPLPCWEFLSIISVMKKISPVIVRQLFKSNQKKTH